jgi:hypothetical protein
VTLESIQTRFEAKYQRGKPNECWEWQGYCDPHGYGSLKVPILGERRVHRISYRLYRGDIPDSMVIRHTCDNPPCVNPCHLLLGTHAQNVKDRVARGRSARRKPRASKLSDEQVREIRRRYAAGERQYPLAAEFGVNQSTISDIIRGKLLTAVA